MLLSIFHFLQTKFDDQNIQSEFKLAAHFQEITCLKDGGLNYVTHKRKALSQTSSDTLALGNKS